MLRSSSQVHHIVKPRTSRWSDSSESTTFICDACQQAKSRRLSYTNSSSISSAPFELIFSDVWAPAPKSVGRYQYYVSFVDDFSKLTWIYLFKNKSLLFN
jgi:hypothetical protein